MVVWAGQSPFLATGQLRSFQGSCGWNVAYLWPPAQRWPLGPTIKGSGLACGPQSQGDVPNRCPGGEEVLMRGQLALLAAALTLPGCGSGSSASHPSVVTTVLVPNGSPIQVPVQTNAQLSGEVAQLQIQVRNLQGQLQCLRRRER